MKKKEARAAKDKAEEAFDIEFDLPSPPDFSYPDEDHNFAHVIPMSRASFFEKKKYNDETELPAIPVMDRHKHELQSNRQVKPIYIFWACFSAVLIAVANVF